MYCKKCGKDISEMKYCPWCGTPSDEKEGLNQSDTKGFLTECRKKIKEIGHNKTAIIVAVLGSIINLILRFSNSELNTEYSLFVQDDYYALSESGQTWMLILMALQIAGVIFLWYDGKKSADELSTKSYVLFAVLLAVQLLAFFLKIPAPY